ncbi:Polynucleotide 5'-hydroxyl-kinase GRC3 [Colletotrichum fructicola]|nr:Polynucleotide 5'-hydroxyl-kinase GRC3 [Colletotrichum fructicola]KAF5498215.1 Polynucleotide 5'-hydroxyl-kinase GRC3 [Colletotrichum fructicola]
MATPKRRKLETSEGSRPMSAFALRQQLLAASPSLSPAPQSEPAPESQASTPTPGRSPARTRPPKRTGNAERAEEPLQQQVAVSGSPKGQAGDGSSGLDAEAPAKPIPQQFSTFRPNKSNSRSYGIKVISGEVTVAGATIRPTDGIQWVHAPHCHGIPVVRCSDETTLELHPHPQAASLRKLERLSPLFRSLWNEPEETKSSKKRAAVDTYKIICTADDAPKRALIQDLRSLPAWNKKLAGLAKIKQDPALSVMLCGPKSSGKSTFGRILSNRLLTTPGQRRVARSVAILDLDPGQPEYTPAGTIALVQIREPNLGPSFTHVATDEQAVSIIRCHSIASVSPASDPELYLECALDLYSHYQSTCQGLPLIINTPGWVLGTGLDLLTELASSFKPTEVIYMSEDGPRESVEGLRANSSPLAGNAGFGLLPYEKVGAEPDNVGPNTTNNITALPPPELLTETINGSIMCLVETVDPKAFGRLRGSIKGEEMDVDDAESSAKLEELVSRTTEGVPYIPNSDAQTLDPRHSQTLGLVLLRGIDTKAGALQMLTPIPLERIMAAKEAGHQLVLIHGKLDSPGWAYTEDLYYQSFGSNDADKDDTVEVMDEDTERDDSDKEPENPHLAGDVNGIPWIEVLQGHEKRPVGSRVWRVRRDLGRGAD